MDDIRELDAELVAISPESVGDNRTFVDDKGLEFDLLSDPGNRVTEQFNLAYDVSDELKDVYLEMGLDLEEFNQRRPWSLPLSARYIVDPEGIIRYERVNVDYTQRPEPKETVEALAELIG